MTVSFIRKLIRFSQFPMDGQTVSHFHESSISNPRYLHPKIFINITSPCLHTFFGFFKKIFKFASLLSKYFQLAYVITRWVILTHAVLFSHQTNSGDWREWMIVTHLESTLVWKYKKRSFVIFKKTIKINKKEKKWDRNTFIF